MTAYAFAMHLRDYLEGLTDQTLADYYAGRLGYNVIAEHTFRYQQQLDDRIYYLVTLPPREEMISEILQQEVL